MDAHFEIQAGRSTRLSRAARLSEWLDGILTSLADPQRQTRTALALIAAYVGLWTLYGTLSKASQDIHFDMGESLVWFHQGWLTAPKHPPLSAWPPGLWFELLPRQDWAFYLLAMLSAGVGLWSAWLLSKRFLAGDKLAVALPLLGFVPFYNFHALKFNANTVMIPLWGIATVAFLRSFESRRAGWAAMAGAAAAAVMLGKYWGLFLLLGFGIGAVLDPRRNAYFRSAAPWISVVAGFAVLSPHLLTLAESTDGSFAYALQSHVKAWYTAWVHAPRYLGAVLAYLIVPIIAVAWATRPDRAALADTFAPADADRRLAIVIVLVPVILPIFVASLLSSEVNALWTMGGFALLPAVLLSSPRLVMSRKAARTILATAMIFLLVLVAASPFVALRSHVTRSNLRAAHAQQMAKEVETRWAAVSTQKLRLLGGETSLINATAFYLHDIPTTLDVKRPDETPWVTDGQIRHDGIALICETSDWHCMEKVEARASPFSPRPPEIFSLSRRFLGVEGGRQTYTLTIVPPDLAANAGQ